MFRSLSLSLYYTFRELDSITQVCCGSKDYLGCDYHAKLESELNQEAGSHPCADEVC